MDRDGDLPQTITFSALTSVTYATGLTVPLSASGGASGNAVTFRVISGPGTISGNTLTVTGAGNIVIEADQAANTGYYAASPVQQTLVVNRASLTITASSQSKVYGQTLTFGSGSTLFSSIGLQNNDTVGSVTLAVSNNGGAATAVVGGSYTITPSAATGGTFLASNYNITYQTGTLTVNKANTNTSGTVSSSSPSLGQNVTITATETAMSPGTGTPTGTVDFYDTTTSSDLGPQGNPVTLTGGSVQLATNHLALGANSITLTYSGDTNFIGSTKTVTVTVVVADYALSTTASGAVALSSSASINVPGVLQINSSSTTALSVAGTASVTASGIQIVGKNKGYTNTGTGQISPTPTTGVASFTDPLAYLPVPSTSGLTNYGTIIDSRGSATLNPGIYNEILLEGTASATLNPGLYIIKGGGVIVEGNATITGSGVVFYNTSTNYPSTGGTYGPFLLTSNSTLSAPTSGTYAGVLLFQDRSNTKTVQIMNGTSNAHPTMNLTGTVYASTAPLVIGNVQVAVGLVASTLTLGGTAVEQLLADSASGTVYSPAQIATAYGINALALDGTGQTIAIVDAYDDPAIYQSVDAFDIQFGVNADGLTLYQQSGPATSFLTVLNLTVAAHESISITDLAPDSGMPSTTNHELVLMAEVRPSSAATSNAWESAFAPAALSALKPKVDPEVQGSVLVPTGTFVSADLVSGPSGERLNRNASPSSGGAAQPLSSPALVVSVGTFSAPNAATVWSDGASSGTPRSDWFTAESSGTSFHEGSIWDSPFLLGENDGSGFWALRLAACGSWNFMRDNRQEDLGTASNGSCLALGLAASLLAVHLFPEPGDEEARKRSRVGLLREKE